MASKEKPIPFNMFFSSDPMLHPGTQGAGAFKQLQKKKLNKDEGVSSFFEFSLHDNILAVG